MVTNPQSIQEWCIYIRLMFDVGNNERISQWLIYWDILGGFVID